MGLLENQSRKDTNGENFRTYSYLRLVHVLFHAFVGGGTKHK